MHFTNSSLKQHLLNCNAVSATNRALYRLHATFPPIPELIP